MAVICRCGPLRVLWLFFRVEHNFLDWCRLWRRSGEVVRLRKLPVGKIVAVGVRFCFELQDNYIGQFCAMFYLHASKAAFCAPGMDIMRYTRFFVGAMDYLSGLRWGYSDAAGVFVVDAPEICTIARMHFRYHCRTRHGKATGSKVHAWRTVGQCLTACERASLFSRYDTIRQCLTICLLSRLSLSLTR